MSHAGSPPDLPVTDSRGRRRRPWTGLVAMGGALVIGGLTLVSPLADAAAFRVGGANAAQPVPQMNARDLTGYTDAASMRTRDRYQTYLASRPAGVNSIYVMGSSELGSNVPQNPISYFSRSVSDTDLFMSGRGYVQSLPHALELAAIADDLRPRKVVLIVSPQWFSPGGMSPQSFGEVASVTFTRDALDNSRLQESTREALTRRVAELADPEDSPGLPVASSGALAPLNPLRTSLHRVAYQFTSRPEDLQKRYSAGRHAPDITGPGDTKGVPHDQIPWAAWQEQAAKDGQRAVTNNPYLIEDGYFTTYVAAKLPTLKDSMATLDYAGPAPEYGDLELFLQTAKDLDVQVLLVSVPMNGRWYDYAGYPASRRALYYAKIRDIAHQWRVPVADFSDQEYTPYFLYDVMHLGWKGWLDVTRACVEFGYRN